MRGFESFGGHHQYKPETTRSEMDILNALFVGACFGLAVVGVFALLGIFPT